MTHILNHHLAKLYDDDVIKLRRFAHFFGKLEAKKHSVLFGVSVTTIRHAIAGYTYKHLNAQYPPYIEPLSTHGKPLHQQKVISDDDVIAMRRQVRREGKRRLLYHAHVHNASRSRIAKAIRGDIFKHVDSIEPPVREKLRKSPPEKIGS